MPGAKEALSFIFLCDGPCNSASWRNDDQSMYWARRDALARISIMCLWQGPQCSNHICDDSSLLFHEVIDGCGSNDRDEILAVLSMSGSLLVPTLPIPIEGALVKQWKCAAVEATKFPQKAEVGNILTKSHLSGRSDVENHSGIQMSFTPWREAAFLPKCPLQSRAGLSASHPSTSLRPDKNMIRSDQIGTSRDSGTNGYGRGTSSANFDTFDKRFILKMMQKQCDIDFLRKHRLAGSEELILKKRNKASILVAYSDWLGSKCSQSQQKTHLVNDIAKCIDESGEGSQLDGSEGSSAARSNSSTKSRLEDTFAVLYNRSLNLNSESHRTTILLLHEDYPHELPVFGLTHTSHQEDVCTVDTSATNVSSNSSSRRSIENGNGNRNGIGNNHATNTSSESESSSHRIICILGAVRDASDLEVASAITAAERMGIRCVGANLGRTAEFTSKIVAALIAHGLAGVLGDAVDSLPSITSNSHNTTSTSTNTSPSQLAAGPVGTLSNTSQSDPRIVKLMPHRAGGWSWDGKSNKTAPLKSLSKLKVLESDACGGTGSIGSSVSAEVKEGRSAVDKSQGSRGEDLSSGSVDLGPKGVVLMHAILWLPYCASEIKIEVEQRETFHTLIQTAVCTLWRSRVASESSQNKDTTVTDSSVAQTLNGSKISKKRKAPHVKSETDNIGDPVTADNSQARTLCKSKCIIQPTLSLVFKDGTSATITQEQLTLSMASRRMAAPSEHQVLLALIELLTDPALNLVKGIPLLSEDNECSSLLDQSSVPSLKMETLKDVTVDEGNGAEIESSDSLWIRNLINLLPTGLKRRQRKRVIIVDMLDLVSTGNIGDVSRSSGTCLAADSICVKRKGEGSHNHGVDNSITLPCLSHVAYGAKCSCAHSADVPQGCADDDDDQNPTQVLVLLRPSLYCGLKTAKSNKFLGTRGKSTSSILQTLSDSTLEDPRSDAHRRYLNQALNNWLYGKKIGSHDRDAPSTLYCRASLFSYTAVQPSSGSFPSSSPDMSVTETQQHDATALTVSPGVAVSVLQHWAYHQRLLPTLKAAIVQYTS